jgi:hypothetical protein
MSTPPGQRPATQGDVEAFTPTAMTSWFAPTQADPHRNARRPLDPMHPDLEPPVDIVRRV